MTKQRNYTAEVSVHGGTGTELIDFASVEDLYGDQARAVAMAAAEDELDEVDHVTVVEYRQTGEVVYRR